MLVKQKLVFLKKCKNMSTKQEVVSDAAFKTWPFSSSFNFACKYGWVTIATCKYYCLLVVDPAITNCCKELHVIWGRVPWSVFENAAIHEDLPGFKWKPLYFLIISKCCNLYQKSLFFLVTFYSMIIFDQPFRQCCYHYLLFMDPVNSYSKSKLLVKE